MIDETAGKEQIIEHIRRERVKKMAFFFCLRVSGKCCVCAQNQQFIFKKKLKNKGIL